MVNMPLFENLDISIKPQRIYKISILGPGFVGKTAITIQFCEGKFEREYKMTIGANFGSKGIRYKERNYALQIIDVAGQERFSSIRSSYYSGSLGAILVFDLTNKLTFQDCPNWVCEFQETAGLVPIIMAGNKVDLPDKRQISYEEAKEFADSINSIYFETSAKTKLNIDNMFASVIDSIEEHRITEKVNIGSYASIEQGFDSLNKLLDLEAEAGKIYDAVLFLKHSIFKKNPHSRVLGNMSDWSLYLARNGFNNNEVREHFVNNVSSWKNYYDQSIQEGQSVTSNIL